jgi:hypothetical protein
MQNSYASNSDGQTTSAELKSPHTIAVSALSATEAILLRRIINTTYETQNRRAMVSSFSPTRQDNLE